MLFYVVLFVTVNVSIGKSRRYVNFDNGLCVSKTPNEYKYFVNKISTLDIFTSTGVCQDILVQ